METDFLDFIVGRSVGVKLPCKAHIFYSVIIVDLDVRPTDSLGSQSFDAIVGVQVGRIGKSALDPQFLNAIERAVYRRNNRNGRHFDGRRKDQDHEEYQQYGAPDQELLKRMVV